MTILGCYNDFRINIIINSITIFGCYNLHDFGLTSQQALIARIGHNTIHDFRLDIITIFGWYTILISE